MTAPRTVARSSAGSGRTGPWARPREDDGSRTPPPSSAHVAPSPETNPTNWQRDRGQDLAAVVDVSAGGNDLLVASRNPQGAYRLMWHQLTPEGPVAMGEVAEIPPALQGATNVGQIRVDDVTGNGHLDVVCGAHDLYLTPGTGVDVDGRPTFDEPIELGKLHEVAAISTTVESEVRALVR